VQLLLTNGTAKLNYDILTSCNWYLLAHIFPAAVHHQIQPLLFWNQQPRRTKST